MSYHNSWVLSSFVSKNIGWRQQLKITMMYVIITSFSTVTISMKALNVVIYKYHTLFWEYSYFKNIASQQLKLIVKGSFKFISYSDNWYHTIVDEKSNHKRLCFLSETINYKGLSLQACSKQKLLSQVNKLVKATCILQMWYVWRCKTQSDKNINIYRFWTTFAQLFRKYIFQNIAPSNLWQ